MFRSAYIRLTVWYVVILMALSLAFSVWVYHEAMNELRMGLNGSFVMQFQERGIRVVPEEVRNAIEQQYQNTHGRIIFNLVILNVGVFAVGACAAYVLARRTLRPIEEAVEAQNRFTADASHELRTPLAAMKTEIEVMLRDQNASKPELRELLQSNLEEIDRMSDLAQGLLTLARPGEAPVLAALPAKPVIAEVLQRLQPLADAKNITLDTHLAEFDVVADAKAMGTIISILLDNAIKYSPAQSRITISMKRKDGSGYISVKDQGPGIATNDLPHVFDRFYRADSSRTKERVAGHGLGLSIAQKLVAGLGGTIHAKSKVGKGSEFTLRLNISQ
jgi:two-component system sensor histidine kinase CiaH